ncbi:MAG: hypothetical protein KJO64_06730, partial [Bacteroidia bacterium]|nr:hypothetical protein [Bacteroidia bacterium]
MKKIFPKVRPHLFALLAAVAVTFIFFNPLFQGKELNQHDVVQARGMSSEIREYYDETGEYSLWTNSMFSGMPTIQIWAQYPGNLITHAVNITRLGLPRSAALFFTYILGMYILLISLNFKPLASILGSLAFSFSTINILILMAGHLAKVAAVAYVMPILGGLFLAYRGKYL